MAFDWYEYGPFTIFDFETTGLSPVNDRIVEIGAKRIDCDGTIFRFETLVNPYRNIPYHASNVHHITNDMVKDAPGFDEAGQDFLDFAEDSTLVAHNAKFDLAFLHESLNREGLPLWQGKTMDSIYFAKIAFPGFKSYSLQNLKKELCLGMEYAGEAHRAGADVEWTFELFGKTMQALIDADKLRM